MDKNEIIFFEELQANAFPALQTLQYDGWSIRFGGGFTYRVNCANPIYSETLPAAEKLAYAEDLYRASALSKSIIKLHEGVEPARLNAYESMLDAAGYSSERRGNIYLCPLEDFNVQPTASVIIESVTTDEWLKGFLTMNNTAQAQFPAAFAMLKNIAMPVAAASIIEDGKMIACGLGVMERGHIGLYDIYVDASQRRRGLGRDICSAIMAYGKAHGCSHAYLQVLSDNDGARALYHQLGYEDTYEYWYRVKNID